MIFKNRVEIIEKMEELLCHILRPGIRKIPYLYDLDNKKRGELKKTSILAEAK